MADEIRNFKTLHEFSDAYLELLKLADGKNVEWSFVAFGEKNASDPLGQIGIIGFRDKITTTEQAKQQIVAAAGDVGDNASSLDQAADNLLQRVGAFFGECVGGDTFCGLSIDEVRNEAGVLQSLKLVACDLVSGEPVRREAR